MTKAKSRLRIVSMLLILACILSIPAYAVTNASDQICAYDAEAAACGGGKVAIIFTIEGTNIMNTLGASKIKIYDPDGRLVEVFLKSDEGMTASGKIFYGNTMYFYGTTGVEYEIVVTVFAEDDRGSDSRNITVYVTA